MKNNRWTKFIIFLLTISISNNTICQQLKSESTEKVQAAWLEALGNSKSLEPFYSESSGIMLNDELFMSLEEINNQLLALIKNVGQFNSYKTLEVYQLRDNQKFVLGVYETASGKVLSTITGWKNKNKWTKEFEVIYDNTDYSNLGTNLVYQAREDWKKYSNQHRPDLIVDEVFSEDGKYFNRGTLYKGREIIDAYSYMNNESYKIKLESLKVLQINGDIIYDIGTFEVGGKGLYTLIWKKEFDTWKLLLDFNF